MKKFKYSTGFAFLFMTATALTACGNKKDIRFWSSFGAAYSGAVDRIVEKVEKQTGVKIEHESKGSYPEIRKAMILGINDMDIPELAIGYPDHFVSYLGSNVLTPLDDLFTQDELNDYIPEYLEENYFYDNGGANAQRHLYGLPFNKSTELLGYNGVFVDYCATINPDLANVPATWGEWATKGPEYNAIFEQLLDGKVKLYGTQDANGHASGFNTSGASGELLLDFSNADKAESYLMSWDATDNAFITLIKQWGARYTVLPESQMKNPVDERIGEAWFTSSTDLPYVRECLRFFNSLHKAKLFAVPKKLGGKYATDAFEQCKVMFMVCSSGGLSYNTTNWAHRFRVAPIPYKEADKKYVISQGANICLTSVGNTKKAVQVMKALTRGEIQTDWCLETGYFPGSYSSKNSDRYDEFIKSTDYSSGTKVAFREGAAINRDIYTKASEGWHNFVDPAFDGSAILREKLAGVLEAACNLSATATDAEYNKIFTDIKNNADLKQCGTLEFK